MITPKNLTKHTITPNNHRKSGYAVWGDDEVTWGDAFRSWGSPSFTMVNLAKHTITPINKIKN